MARRSAAQIAAQKKAAAASAKARKSKASSKAQPMTARDAPGLGNKTVKTKKDSGGLTMEKKMAAKAAGIKADQARRAERRKKFGPAPAAKSARMGITRGVYSGKSAAEVDTIYANAGYKIRNR